MHERTEQNQAELIADLQDEAAALRRHKSALEAQVEELRFDLRRTRRNVGYRVVNGIARAWNSLHRSLFRNGPTPPFATPLRSAVPLFPCSGELTALIQTLGESLQSIFFTWPSRRNWALHKRLSRRAAWALCFGPEELRKAITGSFFAIPREPLSAWNGPPAFAHQDLIVIDCDDSGPLRPLLKGRFWPHQKILCHGKAIPRDFPATQTGPDFSFYAAPPASWLDPRHACQPAFAPWKSSQRRLTGELPSGAPWPKISIVTPSFNQGKFITDTLESVLGQNYPNFEYLVLDGGSTDETRGILDRYRRRLAYSCSQKDKGQADAINQGFARATGDILAWLNSDDQYPADALMQVAVAFDLFPDADVVVGGCGLVQGTNSIPSRTHHSVLPIGEVVPLPVERLLDLDNCWLKGHFFYQPEVFWRRRIWEKAGAHVVDDLYYCFDYDLWVRMAQAGAKVVHIPDLLALFRVHPEQKTHGNNLPFLPELKLVKSRRATAVRTDGTVAKA